MLFNIAVGLIVLFFLSIVFLLPMLGFFIGFTGNILDETKYEIEGARHIDGR